jgi:hypothetical protein
LALVEQVIKRVRLEGFGVLGDAGRPMIEKPRPLALDVLATLTFPNGQPLSPSLKHWLAFDCSWLGWFEDERPVFKPLKLGEYVSKEFDSQWGGIYSAVGKGLLTGDCYGLPFGPGSRRFLYAGHTDSLGEYPVIMIDTDDLPYVAIEYPGLDVYLAAQAGVLAEDEVIDATHPIYGWRVREHAQLNLGGRVEFELGTDVWFDADGTMEAG